MEEGQIRGPHTHTQRTTKRARSACSVGHMSAPSSSQERKGGGAAADDAMEPQEKHPRTASFAEGQLAKLEEQLVKVEVQLAKVEQELRSAGQRLVEHQDRLLRETDEKKAERFDRIVQSLTGEKADLRAEKADLRAKEAQLLEMKDKLLGGLTGGGGRRVSCLTSELRPAMLSVPRMCAHPPTLTHSSLSLSVSVPLAHIISHCVCTGRYPTAEAPEHVQLF